MNMIDAPRFGTRIGLARVDYLLRELKIDRDWLERTALTVTGSNGKGSTAVMCSEIAQAHGFRVGLFTSPHLYHLEERIKLNGASVESSDFQLALSRVQAAATKYMNEVPGQVFGGFELVFAAATDIFFRNACEVCVYEAGIGGRFDPVRLTKGRVAALTSLDLEHTQLLGETLELICCDKIDICANGGTLFFGENCLPLEQSIATYCSLREITPRCVGKEIKITNIEVGSIGTTFVLNGAEFDEQRLFVSLVGRHQANNAALAVALFSTWLKSQNGKPFSIEITQSALSQVRWPGRLEIVSENPLVVIDVGHTPDGISTSLAGLREAFPQKKFVLVVGVSRDKDAESIVRLLVSEFEQVVVTRAYYKGMPPSKICEIAERSVKSAKVVVAETIEIALQKASELAEREKSGIYVAGGMYLAIEFAQALRGLDPKELPHLTS